jgi:capsular exopolysaccharide synthesis family protein
MGKMQRALRKSEEMRVRAAGDAAESGVAVPLPRGTSMTGGEANPDLVFLTDPKSLQAEQFRMLRDRLLMLSPNEPLKALLVTSGARGEGKSVAAANLACAFAENEERRVVVVDANMRAPSLHDLLALDNQKGLSDYLGGGTMLEMVVQRTRLPNLWALPAGRVASNAQELLAGKRMDDLLARLRRDYDTVIFDTPSADSIGDAAVLAARCDGSIVVVRMERTHRDAAKKAVETLKRSQANVLGVLATGV